MFRKTPKGSTSGQISILNFWAILLSFYWAKLQPTGAETVVTEFVPSRRAETAI